MNNWICTTAGQAIGYKEMLNAVCGKCSQEEAVRDIQLASRRYAKRQLTWFRHQNGFNLIDVSMFDNFEEIVNFVADMFERSKNVL